MSLDMIWSWKSSSPVTISAAGSRTSQSFSVMGVITADLPEEEEKEALTPLHMSDVCIFKRRHLFLNIVLFSILSPRFQYTVKHVMYGGTVQM